MQSLWEDWSHIKQMLEQWKNKIQWKVLQLQSTWSCKANECKEKSKFEGKCHKFKKHGHKVNEFKEKPKFEGKYHKCKWHGHKAS